MAGSGPGALCILVGSAAASRCRSCCASSAPGRPPDGWCPSSRCSPAPSGWRCRPTACSPGSRSAASRWSVSAPSGGRPGRLSLAGGLLLGTAVFLSYGLVLFGLVVLVPLVLTVRRHGWRPNRSGPGWSRWPARARSSPLHAGLGFNWLTGLGQLRIRYYQGIAAQRPVLLLRVREPGGLADQLLAAAGGRHRPLDRRAQARASLLRRRIRWWRGWRSPGWLAAVVADLSALSKAETERIWLSFGASRTPVSPCSAVGAPPGPWSAARYQPCWSITSSTPAGDVRSRATRTAYRARLTTATRARRTVRLPP